jgi:hypothetical protein
MKAALYFPVFVNDYDELPLTTLKRKWGIKGYGVYTFLRTKLQDVDNYEYPVQMIPDLAYMAGISEEEMTDIIYNSGLFVVGNDYFSCPMLDEALKRHNGIIEKKSEQGKKGGKARMSTLTEEQKRELSKIGNEKRWGKKSQQNPGKNDNDGINAGNAGINIIGNAGSIPDNDIEIDKEIEKEIEIDKETEIEKEIEMENEMETKPSQKPSSDFSNFNPIEIENEIKSFKSDYWIEKNYEFVCNLYIQFKQQYSNSKITLSKFEKVLFFHICKALDFEKKDDNSNMEINDYFLSRPVIDINIIQTAINGINEDEQIKGNYKFIIDTLQIVTHQDVDDDAIDVIKAIG